MDLLKSYGGVIYGLITLAAFLCGLLVSLVLLGGLAYANLAGGEPGDRVDRFYIVIAASGILATVTLFIGLLGVGSTRQSFPIVTILSTEFLLCLLVPYAAKAVRGQPLLWTLPLIFAEVSSPILSVMKLKQLRNMR